MCDDRFQALEFLKSRARVSIAYAGTKASLKLPLTEHSFVLPLIVAVVVLVVVLFVGDGCGVRLQQALCTSLSSDGLCGSFLLTSPPTPPLSPPPSSSTTSKHLGRPERCHMQGAPAREGGVAVW